MNFYLFIFFAFLIAIVGSVFLEGLFTIFLYGRPIRKKDLDFLITKLDLYESNPYSSSLYVKGCVTGSTNAPTITKIDSISFPYMVAGHGIVFRFSKCSKMLDKKFKSKTLQDCF